MKLALSSTGKDLESALDQQFGRCPYFIIIDPDTMEFEALQNDSGLSPGGAGIAAAQFIAGKGAEIVLTGVCGPNAVHALAGANIRIFDGLSGKISDVIARYKSGELEKKT